MKNISFCILLLWLCPMLIIAQSRIEKAGSPDFVLSNTSVLNAGIASRMLFKTGNYFTGGIATVGVNASNARLSFYTQTSADMNALAERMTITNSGFVGIANNSPVFPLHLKHGGMGFSQESPSGEARIGFYTLGASAYVQTHNNIPMLFSTNNGSPHMALTTTGRFGIGTTNPVSKLEVNGKTTITQQGGEDAALELNGTLKVTGSAPAAFTVTATDPNQIIIDHPTTNNNPDAMIFVTCNLTPSQQVEGHIGVRYNEITGFWKIEPLGVKVTNFYLGNLDIERCDGVCLENLSFPNVTFNSFLIGTKFNVLVIDK